MSEQMSNNIAANNKRIAKNTLFLYGRMLLMMIISLYTSRVVLNALGVEDYGIYNVVGGLVAMSSMLSASFSAAISRFITFELGKGNIEKLKTVFCTAINVQFILIVIITVLLETAGLWFLNNKMVIPSERMTAANWVFQFTLISFAVNLLYIPYNAAIVAHERMSVFAYISILDAVAKLLIAVLIYKNPIDRLVYYGLLILTVSLLMRFIYTWYCNNNFEECKYKLMFDKAITKEILEFAGWNAIGASSAIIRDGGGNMLLNLFFGPAVNAARGVTMSLNGAVSGFVSNFMTALNPQITKSYACGNYKYMFKLIFQGARFSYYILLILVLPIIFTTQYLLELWLGVVPDHAADFTILVLFFTLSESLATPLVTAMLATGTIRNYQIIVGGCQVLNLPISYMLLRHGCPPESVFMVAIAISVLCEMTRLIMLRGMINLSVRAFIKNVYLNVIAVTIVSAIFPFIIKRIIGIDGVLSFIIICVISVISALVTIYFVGCNKHDKAFVHTAIVKLINRKYNDKDR